MIVLTLELLPDGLTSQPVIQRILYTEMTNIVHGIKIFDSEVKTWVI